MSDTDRATDEYAVTIRYDDPMWRWQVDGWDSSVHAAVTIGSGWRMTKWGARFAARKAVRMHEEGPERYKLRRVR